MCRGGGEKGGEGEWGEGGGGRGKGKREGGRGHTQLLSELTFKIRVRIITP